MHVKESTRDTPARAQLACERQHTDVAHLTWMLGHRARSFHGCGVHEQMHVGVCVTYNAQGAKCRGLLLACCSSAVACGPVCRADR